MKRFVALIMLMSMMFSSLAFAPSDRIEDRISDQEPTRVEEVKELRERNSETYLLSDGSYECVVFAENKYYKDGSGKLAEIDNSIKKIENPVKGSNYSYKLAANDTIFYFAENTPSIKAESVDMSFSFRLNNTGKTAMKTKAVQGGSEKYQTIFDYPMSAESCLTYPNTLPDTDIIYNTADGNLKEYIVLRSANAPTEFRFTFETNGLLAQKADDGTVEFVDENGEIAFSLSSLFAMDAAGAYTEKLGYEIISADKNSAVIEIRLSTDYVNDPARVFPVMIDPSVMVTGANKTYDSFVSEKNRTSNYYLKEFLCTGRSSDYGRSWSYIEFDIQPDLMWGKNITGAYFNIRKKSGSAPSIKAYNAKNHWTSNTVSWAVQPGYDENNATGVAVHVSNDWYRIYMTDFVKQWCSDSRKNNGFVLRDTRDTNTASGYHTEFYSSDAASPNKPELHIVYTEQPAYNLKMISYVDMGFVTRFSNALNRVNTYQQFVADSLKKDFNVNVTFETNTTVSSADACKILQLLGVTSSTLARACIHEPNHLTRIALRDKLISQYGNGTPTTTKYIWTGHIMRDQVGERSASYSSSHIVIMTTYAVVDPNTYKSFTDDIVNSRYKHTLLHETGHQLGTPDHYCYGTDGSPSGKCSNKYCCSCNGRAEPLCIMSTGYTNSFCSSCNAVIKAHLADHHG